MNGENLDLLGEVLTRELPGEAQVEMARLVGAKKVQLEISQHLVRSLTTVCAAIGVQPIPFADFPILTAIQFAMVSGMMHVSGRELGLRSSAEFFGALGVNIGAGMVFREGARAAAKLLRDGGMQSLEESPPRGPTPLADRRLVTLSKEFRSEKHANFSTIKSCQKRNNETHSRTYENPESCNRL